LIDAGISFTIIEDRVAFILRQWRGVLIMLVLLSALFADASPFPRGAEAPCFFFVVGAFFAFLCLLATGLYILLRGRKQLTAPKKPGDAEMP
jgi:hypothetical protein